MGIVRWERLFEDLAAQFDAAEAEELEWEVRDRSRREAARLRLVDRLRPALGAALAVHLPGAGTLRGTLASVGTDWLLLREDTGLDALVPVGSVLSLGGLGAVSAEPGTESRVRLTLGYVLRGLARDRSPVGLTLTDGSTLHGTLDRVGADFAEVAEHPPGEPRRPADVRGVRTVPFGAIAVVRSGQ